MSGKAGPNNLGLLLQRQGKRRDAGASFRTALQLVPEHVGAQVNLGRLYLAEDQPDRAVACFDAALDLEPSQPEAQLGRGAVGLILRQV